MTERLIRMALERRGVVVVVYLFLAALAVRAGMQLPVDAFPDSSPTQVQVNSVAPNLNPEEIEQQITFPVELAIGGLPGLVDVRSVSKFGFSQVVATFDDSTRVIDARQYVAERVSSVSLPAGIAAPTLGPLSTGLGEIFHYLVRSTTKRHTLEELRTLHDWVVRPELRKVPGVAEVNSWGGREKQFHVIVKPEALIARGLSLDHLRQALVDNNQNVGGGQVVVAGETRLIHGLGRVGSIESIGQIVIDAFDGVPVRVRDVADVVIGHEIRRGAVTADGDGEVVLGLAFMLKGANPQEVTAELRQRLSSLSRSLPPDVTLDIVYDRSVLTGQVIATATHNLAAGAALVIAVLFLLMGDIRAGLLVALAIPLSLLFALLGMERLGIVASLLSLGALDFGILVDGSIVMTEANMRAMAEKVRSLGRPLTPDERLDSVTESSCRVARPIFFGLGIIAIVFLPVLTLEGIEGKMFRPMAWTFIFALAGALIIALTLSPLLSFWFVRPGSREGMTSRLLGAVYAPFLALAFRLRFPLLIGVAAILAGTGWLASGLGGVFIPRLSEGSIVINTIRLAGVSLDESTRYNSRIERLLIESFPDEIERIWSRTGSAEVATDPMGTELTDIFLSLHPREQWKRAGNQKELTALIQEAMQGLPGLNAVFTQPIEMRMNEMASGIRADLGVTLAGDDFDRLQEVADQIQLILARIRGASDLSVDQLTGQPKLQIAIDPARASRHGVPSADVLDFVEALGTPRVSEIFEGQRRFPLVLRFDEGIVRDRQQLARTRIPTRTGKHLPLSALARIEETEGLSTINRQWGRRVIRIQCNVTGRDLASFVEEARQRVSADVDLPVGYVVDWGGQFEHLERARTRLALVVPLTLALVFFLLHCSLGNLRDVFVIYTGIPFAIVGAVLALWTRGLPISVSAAIGFIALGGIAVLNGQVLVSAIGYNLSQGIPLREAVCSAARSRLIPVLATAITDALGFLPMALSTGVGAEIQRPLATVVIGGITTSAMLTLFVLPVLYDLTARRNSEAKHS